MPAAASPLRARSRVEMCPSSVPGIRCLGSKTIGDSKPRAIFVAKVVKYSLPVCSHFSSYDSERRERVISDTRDKRIQIFEFRCRQALREEPLDLYGHSHESERVGRGHRDSEPDRLRRGKHLPRQACKEYSKNFLELPAVRHSLVPIIHVAMSFWLRRKHPLKRVCFRDRLRI